ncbi:MAG: hypothetical protein Q7U04_02000 [Bacteriovorax sp.]|nr:hypothetical protein [Bacteriovorax sp.]
MKSSIMLGLVSVLCLSAQAHAEVQKNSENARAWNEEVIKEYSNNRANSRSIEFSAGYVSNRMKDDTSEEIKTSGVGLRLGKSFSLTNELKTTTSLIGSYSTLKPNQNLGSLNGNFTEIGLSQRLSLDLGSSGTIVRPFIEGGASRGKFSLNDNYSDEELSTVSTKVDGNYNKFSGALGVQLVLDNNIVPFIMYDYSKLKLDSKVKGSVKVNGETITLNPSDFDIGSQKLTSHTLTVGIGFLF